MLREGDTDADAGFGFGGAGCDDSGDGGWDTALEDDGIMRAMRGRTDAPVQLPSRYHSSGAKPAGRALVTLR
jgi:hypothetical protein